MFQAQKFAGPILMVAALICAAGPVGAATTTSSSAPQPSAAIVGKPATGVVCLVVKNADVAHVQAVNKGKVAVPAGDTFAFTIMGPTKKTSETITFKTDLAPGKAVNITNAIKAARVTGCAPDALS